MVILGQQLAQLEIQCQPHSLLFLGRSTLSGEFVVVISGVCHWLVVV